MSKTEKLISKIFEGCTACHGDDQPTHEEEQSRMAMSDLRNIAENVTELQSLVDENFPLEDWAEAKITKAADYVRSVCPDGRNKARPSFPEYSAPPMPDCHHSHCRRKSHAVRRWPRSRRRGAGTSRRGSRRHP